MLEGSRCFIFKQIGGTSGPIYRLTTTLAAFFGFGMLKDIDNINTAQLGTLSRAAKVQFNFTVPENLTLAEVWKRAHCLTVVSEVH